MASIPARIAGGTGSNPAPLIMWTLEQLERRLPQIKWREPLMVASIETPDEKHYACRVCIANSTLHGWMIPSLPTDPEDMRKHIESEHIASQSD